MNTLYKENQLVKVASSRGVIDVVVVKDLGEVLLVCREDEYASAAKEGRSPVAVGFKKADVLVAR